MQEHFKLFTSLISSINREIRHVKTQIMEKHNLRCPHISTLYYLYVDNGLTLKELCEKCNEDKGAISRSVKSLEEEGLVKTHTTQKKYKQKLKLTEKGKEIGRDVADKIDITVKKAIENLSDEDKACVYRSLKTISENLEKVDFTTEKI